MSEQRRLDALLHEDWADVWDALPEAPPLVPRPKTTQITLRIPVRMLARIKAVAAAKSLPYHPLARAWIVEAIRASTPSANSSTSDEPQAEQLNIKLDQAILDGLKGRADELRRPYHRLAREWIEAALIREEKALGTSPSPTNRPAIKDLMVLLLHSPASGGDEAIRGMTRLQKLLFVIEQKLTVENSRFYPYNYGPFNEEVNDAAEALRLAGFLRGAQSVSPAPPSFAEMMATAQQRSGPRADRKPEEFALTQRGHEAAERLRQSNRAYDQLFAYISHVRKEWDTPQLDELVEKVYVTWPKYAEKSLIRGEVAERAARRRRD
ncbi:MAG: hypothetical protein ABSB34_12455 [Candidatus Limnocylindrales bacterium]|jgi:predicted DNA binding CopG/RHH family protein